VNKNDKEQVKRSPEFQTVVLPILQRLYAAHLIPSEAPTIPVFRSLLSRLKIRETGKLWIDLYRLVWSNIESIKSLLN
jgi:hypothetical protein